jgi:hypothetical protein
LNLKIPGLKPGEVVGSGPGGKVEIGDIHAKLVEIRGDVDETVERAKPVGLYVAVGGAVLVIVLAFLLGRSRGRRKDTWVEIRRL